MREDDQTELLGQGDMVVAGDNARFQAQNIVQGDILLFGNGIRRVVQSIVLSSNGISNVRMDRASPTDGTFQGWGYLRRAGASARTQLRLGEGTVAVTGNSVVYAPIEAGHTHTVFTGDTLVVGLYARTITRANAVVWGLDESIPGGITTSAFAWIPKDGERVSHLLVRQPSIAAAANVSLRIGGANMTETSGSYGASGCLFGTFVGKIAPRFLDAKDVLHVRVRSGYRQVLSGYPVPGRDSVASGTPPLVCVQSISSAVAGVPSVQSFQGFSMRVEPPQNNLYRFLN